MHTRLRLHIIKFIMATTNQSEHPVKANAVLLASSQLVEAADRHEPTDGRQLCSSNQPGTSNSVSAG